MKYIKTFENDSLRKYKVGDYVLLKGEYFVDRKQKFGKVVKVEIDIVDPVPYLVLVTIGEMSVAGWMIERKLTQDEIRQFELEIAKNKYNF